MLVEDLPAVQQRGAAAGDQRGDVLHAGELGGGAVGEAQTAVGSDRRDRLAEALDDRLQSALGAAQVIEQSGVVEGLSGAGGEVATELQVVVGERLAAAAADERERAEGRSAADQREHHRRLVAGAEDVLDVLGAGGVAVDLVGQVVQQHRLAGPERRGYRMVAGELERMLLAQPPQVVGDGLVDGRGDRAAQDPSRCREVEDGDIAERGHEEVGEAREHHLRLEHRLEQVAHGSDEIGPTARGPLGIPLGDERPGRVREPALRAQQREGDDRPAASTATIVSVVPPATRSAITTASRPTTASGCAQRATVGDIPRRWVAWLHCRRCYARGAGFAIDGPARTRFCTAIRFSCQRLGGLGGGLQRLLEHLADGHDRVERHRLADVVGDVVEVAAVALGQDHVGQPRGVRGEHLLLEPADRQHAALQRDLAGHADRVLAPRGRSAATRAPSSS